jgi:hypothetical protein
VSLTSPFLRKSRRVPDGMTQAALERMPKIHQGMRVILFVAFRTSNCGARRAQRSASSSRLRLHCFLCNFQIDLGPVPAEAMIARENCLAIVTEPCENARAVLDYRFRIISLFRNRLDRETLERKSQSAPSAALFPSKMCPIFSCFVLR